MELSTHILAVKPREEAGPRTARKYTFQKDLSLFLLINEHTIRDDYVFLFDFHDDLLILDSTENPSEIEFYQIKSKDKGNWTINKLAYHKEGNLSILGKLYKNKISFPEHTKTLKFISNRPFAFKKLIDETKAETRKQIFATEMNDEDITECNLCIQTEHKLSTIPEFEKITAFQVTILSNEDSSTHCIGALTKLINLLNPNHSINPQLAYDQIINEITRKTGAITSDKVVTKIEEVYDLKGITKTQFIAYLKKAGLYKSNAQEWAEVKTSLEHENVIYSDLMKYQKAWREVNVRLVKDQNNIVLYDVERQIQTSLEMVLDPDSKYPAMSLIEMIEKVYTKITCPIFDEYFIKCLIIRKINETTG